MSYKKLSTARTFANDYFHYAKIYKNTVGKYEVLPAHARKPYKSWKLIESISKR